MAWTDRELLAALTRWEDKLVADGRARGTVTTYVRDARAFIDYLAGRKPVRTARAARAGSSRRSGVMTPDRGVGALAPVPGTLRQLLRRWSSLGSPRQQGIMWPRDRWIAAFPEHRALLAGLPARLDREAVREVARRAVERPEVAIEAFVVAFTWGFGSVGYGPHRARRILDSSPQAPQLLWAVARTLAEEGAVRAYGRLAVDCRLRYFGPAFGTKYLAFCQSAGQPLAALIHDELVSSWLARNGSPGLVSRGWSEQTYGAYLAQMHAWAAELGCEAETVEYLIFQEEANARGNQWST